MTFRIFAGLFLLSPVVLFCSASEAYHIIGTSHRDQLGGAMFRHAVVEGIGTRSDLAADAAKGFLLLFGVDNAHVNVRSADKILIGRQTEQTMEYIVRAIDDTGVEILQPLSVEIQELPDSEPTDVRDKQDRIVSVKFNHAGFPSTGNGEASQAPLAAKAMEIASRLIGQDATLLSAVGALTPFEDGLYNRALTFVSKDGQIVTVQIGRTSDKKYGITGLRTSRDHNLFTNSNFEKIKGLLVAPRALITSGACVVFGK